MKLNLNILNGFSKNNEISNLMKIHLVGVDLFHMDEQTDILRTRPKLTYRYKNEILLLLLLIIIIIIIILVAGSCECGNELSGSIKCGEFF